MSAVAMVIAQMLPAWAENALSEYFHRYEMYPIDKQGERIDVSRQILIKALMQYSDNRLIIIRMRLDDENGTIVNVRLVKVERVSPDGEFALVRCNVQSSPCTAAVHIGTGVMILGMHGIPVEFAS